VGRQPVALDLDRVTGAAVRSGADPREVYRRPFVTVWTSLQQSGDWAAAVDAGGARAVSTAAMDVQLTMRQTLVEIGSRDDRILGFARVPDGDACDFCSLIAGQRYTTEDLMPVHNHCGCGVDVITADERGDFTGNADNDLDMPSSMPIAEHGELGPVVVNPDHKFAAL
jgi:hypothetical protein